MRAIMAPRSKPKATPSIEPPEAPKPYIYIPAASPDSPAEPDYTKMLAALDQREYSREVASAEARVIMAAALSAAQYAPALSAAKLRAELAGLLVQRTEVGKPGEFRGISDEDLSAQIYEDAVRAGMPAETAKRLALVAVNDE